MVLANLSPLWNTQTLAAIWKAVRCCWAICISWVQLPQNKPVGLRKHLMAFAIYIADLR